MKNFNDYLVEMEEIQNEDFEVHNEIADLLNLNPFGLTYNLIIGGFSGILLFLVVWLVNDDMQENKDTEEFSESEEAKILTIKEKIKKLIPNYFNKNLASRARALIELQKDNTGFRNLLQNLEKNENFITKIKNVIKKKFPKIYKSFFNKENKDEKR